MITSQFGFQIKILLSINDIEYIQTFFSKNLNIIKMIHQTYILVPNKRMTLPKGKIVIFWKLPDLFCFK